MDLIEEPERGGNAQEYSVSEISGAVKGTIERAFGLVRVRGEVGRVSRPSSGHFYFDLKDDRAVLAAVSWKGQVARMQVRPEEGMEVVATGRLTTFPNQSKYQLIVDDIAPAGAGALMAMLEKRKSALAAEGLFDPARKRPLPYLPEVVGVITSPSGAVIRDILHRLRDRFARHVLVWPVAVQGEACAAQVANAIRGFNALTPGGPVPRPDLIIVARGGGSIEDLWGFNEEVVVRAAAASDIPLISAVGHETDTTLIDHAADVRAPTPTAAAELAVPVRLELLAQIQNLGARLSRAGSAAVTLRGQRLRDLGRGLPAADSLVTQPAQRLDAASLRLDAALRGRAGAARVRLAQASGAMQPRVLRQGLAERTARLTQLGDRVGRAVRVIMRDRQRDHAETGRRLITAARQGVAVETRRIASAGRLLESLGYQQTLQRGFAVVRAEGVVVTSVSHVAQAASLEIQFADGRVTVGARPTKKPAKSGGPDQGSLF